jgi:hypothetical protein
MDGKQLKPAYRRRKGEPLLVCLTCGNARVIFDPEQAMRAARGGEVK